LSTRRLETGWRIREFAPGEGIVAGADLSEHADDEWIGIAVPGDVHRAQMGAGRIPDFFYDRNETACAWMEEREFWHRIHFDVTNTDVTTDGRQELVLHGLDTFATVYLNGEEFGEHHNMFRPAVFDVTAQLLRGARNTQAIPLRSAAPADRGQDAQRMRPQSGADGHAQGAVRLRLGLGSAPADDWHLGSRGALHSAARGADRDSLQHARRHPRRDRAAVSIRVEAERFATALPLVAPIRLTS